MGFMLIRKADKSTEVGNLPSQQLLADMGKYMEVMGEAGILLAGEGLQPSSKGSRVKFSNGKPTVIDGPFINWVKRWPASDSDGNVEIEIRQHFELSLLPKCAKPKKRCAFSAKKRSSLASARPQYFSLPCRFYPGPFDIPLEAQK